MSNFEELGGSHAEDRLEEELTYYSSQSGITDPGPQAPQLKQLPHNIEDLYRAANGLVVHYRMDDLAAAGVDVDRIAEVDSCYADVMLARLFDLDERPLTARRALRCRLVGCCRDFTVLMLTMARQAGIPARARVGFSTYFFPGVQNDHEVAEIWDGERRRWRLVDPQLGRSHHDPNDGVHVDPTDVPRDRFLVAGSAWSACKRRSQSPETFVVHPEISMPALRGWPYLSHNLLCDLAALNKMEMLPWDYWGLAEEVLSGSVVPEESALLNQIAQLTEAQAPALEPVRQLYKLEPALRVPECVTSFSPAGIGRRSVRS